MAYAVEASASAAKSRKKGRFDTALPIQDLFFFFRRSCPPQLEGLKEESVRHGTANPSSLQSERREEGCTFEGSRCCCNNRHRARMSCIPHGECGEERQFQQQVQGVQLQGMLVAVRGVKKLQVRWTGGCCRREQTISNVLIHLTLVSRSESCHVVQ